MGVQGHFSLREVVGFRSLVLAFVLRNGRAQLSFQLERIAVMPCGSHDRDTWLFTAPARPSKADVQRMKNKPATPPPPVLTYLFLHHTDCPPLRTSDSWCALIGLQLHLILAFVSLA